MLKKQSIAGLIVWALIALGVTYLITGSLNPINVYQENVSLIAKIIMSVLLAYVILIIIGLLFMSAPGISEMICPICNKNLMSFVSVYGQPDTCPNCRTHGRITMYHRNCYKAAGQCPVCAEYDPMNDLHKNTF